ncbi:hypothetical protein AVEN_79702-1 [Araneus ventricosus]|uniref:Uncharacterized protein n=1 Tax=Araneus ventricosus TaxID=182803 RepID=A0A4Y1ZRC4_ARAVE|nr:hypothetical protein AVEN_79702-1 [Araneus ventricosus]
MTGNKVAWFDESHSQLYRVDGHVLYGTTHESTDPTSTELYFNLVRASVVVWSVCSCDIGPLIHLETTPTGTGVLKQLSLSPTPIYVYCAFRRIWTIPAGQCDCTSESFKWLQETLF